MKTEKFSGTMESAYGKVLAEKIPFKGTFEAFTIPDSVKDTTLTVDAPEGADAITDSVTYGMVYDAVNNKRKAKARQKAMNTALDEAGIEKPTMEDPQVQLAGMIKILKASGKDEAEARKIAETALGVTLAT